MHSESRRRVVTPAQVGAAGISLMLLALCIYPTYSEMQQRSLRAEARTNLAGLFVAETAYFGNAGRYGSFQEVGFILERGKLTNRFTYRSPATGGAKGSTGKEGEDLFQSQVPVALVQPENTVVPSGAHLDAPSGSAGFTATAVGNLDEDSMLDQWHINDNKQNLKAPDVDDDPAETEKAQAHERSRELTRKGYELFEQDRVKEGIETFRQALTLDDDNVLARVMLADALNTSGDVDGALTEAREAVRRAPAHAMAHVKFGEVLQEKQEWEGATAEYREAIRLDPSNSLAFYDLGAVLKRRGDLGGAIAAFRELVRLNPKDARAQHLLGEVLRDKGDLEAAAAAHREAARLAPKSAARHGELAVTLSHQGDWPGTVVAARQAVALKSNVAAFHIFLAEALGQTGDWSGAEAEADTAVRSDSKQSSAHAILGFARGGLGRVPEAIDALDEALRLDPENSDAHLYKGWVLAKAGRRAEAAVSYHKALDLMTAHRMPAATSWYVRTATAALKELEP